MTVQDNGRPRSVVIACGGLPDDARLVNNRNYPEVADDYAKAIKVYRSLNGEVFLAAHSWFFDLAGKHTKLAANPTATNPYIDPAGYKKWVDDMEKLREKLIADQKAAAPTN
jgi:metallo-beta-lactamase class B